MWRNRSREWLEMKVPWKKEYDEKILGFFFLIAVYLLHLVDLVESVLIHINEKNILYTIYRKMSFLFLLLCKIVEFVSRSNVYMSFVQFFHCIGSNIYWLSGSKCNTCSFWKIWKIEKNKKRKINMVYNFTIQNHCIIFKSWCYQKRTNLHLQFFKDNVAC